MTPTDMMASSGPFCPSALSTSGMSASGREKRPPYSRTASPIRNPIDALKVTQML